MSCLAVDATSFGHLGDMAYALLYEHSVMPPVMVYHAGLLHARRLAFYQYFCRQPAAMSAFLTTWQTINDAPFCLSPRCRFRL